MTFKDKGFRILLMKEILEFRERIKEISKGLIGSSGTPSVPRMSALGRLEELIHEQSIDRDSLPEIIPSEPWWSYVPRHPEDFRAR